jgi:hypothetical protein
VNELREGVVDADHFLTFDHGWKKLGRVRRFSREATRGASGNSPIKASCHFDDEIVPSLGIGGPRCDCGGQKM